MEQVITQTRTRYTKLEAARIWLNRGAALLPVQPGSKKLVKGFGLHQSSITTDKEAGRWFGPDSPYNLAILTGPGLLALDFDSNLLFVEWSNQLPSRLMSYEETSPRGWHVFYKCQVPAGARLIKGVEIKQIITVSPSIALGVKYQVVDRAAPIVEADWSEISSLLLSKETEPVTQPGGKQPGQSRAAAPSKPAMSPGADLLARIKASFPLVELASRFTQLKPSGGNGKFLVGKCPLPEHNDQHASFWVNVERNLWGCFACGVHGDVINLYARLNNVSVHQAIKAMAGDLVK